MSSKQKIKELKRQIRYEEKRISCCAYGKSDLLHLYSLKEELDKSKNKISVR